MQKTTSDGQPGILRYLDDTATASLYRNSKVLIRRDPDGSDAGSKGLSYQKHEVQVHDARQLAPESARTLKANGFELRRKPLNDDQLDFFNNQAIIGDYYHQCVELVEEATQARAFAFDHNIRSASGKKSQQRIRGGQQVQGPAHTVHGDYTLTSAPQRLRDLTRPPSGNDTLCEILKDGESLLTQQMVDRVCADGGRFAIINVWRNITNDPVITHPLALCDGQSVDPDELVVFEIHYQDRIGENYFAKHSPSHQWYYFPEITREEALLIKQWDSNGVLAQSTGNKGDGTDLNAPCTFSFHSAFVDPSAPLDAPDRWSIEVRCMVIYD
jgi:hypothetical protein